MDTVKEAPFWVSTAELQAASSREHERGKGDLVPDVSMGQGPGGRNGLVGWLGIFKILMVPYLWNSFLRETLTFQQ